MGGKTLTKEEKKMMTTICKGQLSCGVNCWFERNGCDRVYPMGRDIANQLSKNKNPEKNRNFNLERKTV